MKKVRNLTFLLAAVGAFTFATFANAQTIDPGGDGGLGEKTKECEFTEIDPMTATVKCKGEGDECNHIGHCFNNGKEENLL